MKRHWALVFVAVAFFGISASGAFALPSSTLLFDRGLPTANVNTGDASQSNIEWADSENTSTPSTYCLPGDDFTLSGSGSYYVNTIRVWSTDSAGLSLLLGNGSGGFETLTKYTSQATSYSNGQGYQGSDGTFYTLYELDFTVNQVLQGGKTYEFFLNGPFSAVGSSSYVNAFLAGSNASLSGSVQRGADGVWLWLTMTGNSTGSVLTWYSGDGGGTSGWGAGWDKNTDANVQVYGSAVPIPAAFLLFAPGLAGLAALRRKFRG